MDTQLVYALDLAGTVVFALSGILLACRSRMDPIGMLVLAAVTAVGGGTLRDLVLGVAPVFWVRDPVYLWVILATVMGALVGFHYIHRLHRVVLPVADAFGLALFVIIGANKALLLDTSGLVAVLMGLFTGVAGGMVRDVLARRVPMVLCREVYATAAIAGGVVYVVLTRLELPMLGIVLSLATTLGLRLAAIRWQLALPLVAWVVIEPSASASPPDDTSSAAEASLAHEQRRDASTAPPQAPLSPAPARPKMRVRLVSRRKAARLWPDEDDGH
ncbi:MULTISPECIES: trimeric intracellular cation channel family protein [Halomonas]|uniref:trimeric intracellular cation channel family protein n=1 Tax=Halomonas TaxID=2745 RepID=UPI001CD56906|nr:MULTISPECIES: trimeric intracellular cation channel family protein [Halomonas]MCA0916430.1 trimeric intracellular cation channel family protein [Halomonas denitrificans]